LNRNTIAVGGLPSDGIDRGRGGSPPGARGRIRGWQASIVLSAPWATFHGGLEAVVRPDPIAEPALNHRIADWGCLFGLREGREPPNPGGRRPPLSSRFRRTRHAGLGRNPLPGTNRPPIPLPFVRFCRNFPGPEGSWKNRSRPKPDIRSGPPPSCRESIASASPMPTYEYRCQKCNARFELSQRISDPPLTHCPMERCPGENWGKGRVQRGVGGGAGLLFKGSGFHITDYRSSEYRSSAAGDSRTPPSSGASSTGAAPSSSTPEPSAE